MPKAASPTGLPDGGLAQLARAPALHAGGQRFESVILHPRVKLIIDYSFDARSVIDIMEQKRIKILELTQARKSLK